jgi:hypothetical protein
MIITLISSDGNAETDDHDDGAGTMEAIYFGSAKGGLNHGGAGVGPWIMADMENALWGADKCVHCTAAAPLETIPWDAYYYY